MHSVWLAGGSERSLTTAVREVGEVGRRQRASSARFSASLIWSMALGLRTVGEQRRQREALWLPSEG
jgi:hypothetical protein